jgi:hypothetical protein
MKFKVSVSHLIFVLSFLFFASITHTHVFLAGNDASRFAHIESLVDSGVSYIDQSEYKWTKDKVTINGHDYSNKPPLLGVIGAGIYLVLKNIFGIQFEKNEGLTVYWLTLIFIGGTTSLLVAQFYMVLGIYKNINFQIRLLTTLALLFGTIITTFSTTFNNHTIAASLIFLAICLARSGLTYWTGAFIGLAFCVDIIPGLIFIPLVSLVLYDLKKNRGLVEFYFVIVMSALVFSCVNYITVGHILPPKFVPGGYDKSSSFSSSIFGVLLPEDYLYPIQCLFGWHGFFTVSPVLFYGLAGLGKVYKEGILFPRKWMIVLMGTCSIFVLGHILFVGSFGGWSYGFRYLIPIIPILIFFIPAVLNKGNINTFKVILVVSILFAFIGVYNPWPPGFEQNKGSREIDSMVINPIASNLTAFMVEHLPNFSLTRKMVTMFISPTLSKSNQYFMYYYYSKGDKKMTLKYMKLQKLRNET